MGFHSPGYKKVVQDRNRAFNRKAGSATSAYDRTSGGTVLVDSDAYCKLSEYLSKYSLHVPGDDMREVAFSIVRMCSEAGREVRREPSERFGHVNLYPVAVLDDWRINYLAGKRRAAIKLKADRKQETRRVQEERKEANRKSKREALAKHHPLKVYVIPDDIPEIWRNIPPWEYVSE